MSDGPPQSCHGGGGRSAGRSGGGSSSSDATARARSCRRRRRRRPRRGLSRGRVRDGIRRGLLLLLARGGRGRGRRDGRAVERPWQEHLVDLVDDEPVPGVERRAVERGVHHPGGDVDVGAVGGEVERVLSPPGVPRLRPQRVADRLQLRRRERRRDDVELHQRRLLLVGEGVERALGQRRERAVGRREHREAAGRRRLALELVRDLLRLARGLQQLDELGELPGFA